MPYIRFQAKFYNVTSNSYIDQSPQMYNFLNYTGNALGFNDDGTVRTDIPISDFEGTNAAGYNIGIWFEYYAKQYYYANNAWPILRLLTSNAVNDYFIEWNHSNPNGFIIQADGNVSNWNKTFQWDDSIDTSGSSPVFNTKRSLVFVSAGDKRELNTLNIIWSGAICATSGGYETQVSYATVNVSVTNRAFICNTGDLLMTINTNTGRIRYFTYVGYGNALACGYKTNRAIGVVVIAPISNNAAIPPYAFGETVSGDTSYTWWNYELTTTFDEIQWGYQYSFGYDLNSFPNCTYESNFPFFEYDGPGFAMDIINEIMAFINPIVTLIKTQLYTYLNGNFDQIPPSDVDPDDIPPEDTPPTPPTPDNPDPYYDPESDPDSPDYDPTKDPSSPDYDPDVPHPPFNPPSTEGGGGDPSPQPPQDVIPAPETPPSYVTTNALFTLYNPSGADLTNLANFLWSPAWSIDTFKKIFANPLDCILGLMVMPYLAVDVGTKNMNVGNIDTGVAMRYFTKQFYDFDCGDFTIEEFYKAYLDYAPYTKVSIFLPYIGDQQLNTDEVMGKTLNVKYRFDLATGDCVAFISVDGSVLYSFSGNCAARLPLSSNNYGGLLPSITGAIVAAGSMAAGVPALGAASALAVSSMKQDIRHTGSISGSAGLMGVQTPYLIITRPRQALPIGQNSFMGYPSFITESLGGLTGYTEVESCHLEHVPCTDEELREIENLLKGGVLF